ncbi:MAG: MAPEG family protein [Sphingorhabdus sp.]
MHSDILQPVAILAAWTMVMWLWMYATRLPAINKLPKDHSSDADVGWTSAKLEELLPAKTQWKAHNYNHLHEQPTIFYAVALSLAFMGAGDGFNAQIAWVYVILRIIHSLFQSLINRVAVRFGIFALASLALIMLTVHAVITAFSENMPHV